MSTTSGSAYTTDDTSESTASVSVASSESISGEEVKIVCVGSTGVGKTSTLVSYTEGKFKKKVTTLMEHYKASIFLREGVVGTLHLWDTAGNEEFDRLRPYSYNGASVFIAMYSVDSAASLEVLESKFIPDVESHVPRARFVVAGNKSDLASSSKNMKVSTEEGQQLAERIGAYGFFEFSALTRRGLKALFDEAIAVGLGGGTRMGKKVCCRDYCSLM